MKVLVVHNYYRSRGGEDTNREAEMELLRGAGHQVFAYTRHNDEIDPTVLGSISVGLRATWAKRTYRELREAIRHMAPAVVHFHNTFPLISPSAYYACTQEGVPAVQTLQNFRLLCPGGNFVRAGKVCEECQTQSLRQSIIHGCYRDSRWQTAAVAGMVGIHSLAQTWTKHVTHYVTCTNFARDKFLAAGFPEHLFSVKPNFIARDPGACDGLGDKALFVGRLSEEKGPQILPSAWSGFSIEIPLEIAGDGPKRNSLESQFGQLDRKDVTFLGLLSTPEVLSRMKTARFLIVPSICYEGFPLAIVEAFACGLPVVASRLGSMAEIVEDGVTGLHFEAGNAADLAAKVQWAWEHPEEMRQMGRAARKEYEAKYTPEKNYQMLMEIYERAIASRN